MTLPLIAFGHPRSADEGALTFVDQPNLAAVVREISQLDVLAVDQLAMPLSQVDLTALTSVERDQIAYWKPETVGDSVQLLGLTTEAPCFEGLAIMAGASVIPSESWRACPYRRVPVVALGRAPEGAGAVRPGRAERSRVP